MRILFILLTLSLLVCPIFADDEITVVTEEAAIVPEEVVVETPGRPLYGIGLMGGVLAGTSGFNLETRIPQSYIFGPATTCLRLAAGLWQTNDTSLRLAPLQIGAIFNFAPGHITGVENYLGVGLNYIVKMTGGRGSKVGGQIFYGISSSGFSGRLFGELGWAVLRPDGLAAQKGATLLFGYSKEWPVLP
ncbi:MAG: hypothetical protein ABIE84_01665 [bacterium]